MCKLPLRLGLNLAYRKWGDLAEEYFGRNEPQHNSVTEKDLINNNRKICKTYRTGTSNHFAPADRRPGMLSLAGNELSSIPRYLQVSTGHKFFIIVCSFRSLI